MVFFVVTQKGKSSMAIYKKNIFSLLCCFLLMAVASYPPLCVASVERPLDRVGDEATFVVVDADTPAAIIVIAEDADEQLMALADELRHYLEAISGKAFQITNVVSDGRSILLGTSEQVSLLAYPEIVQQLNANPILSKEAFVIKPEKNRLLLVGNTSLGVSHAVFTLLEELGCRWFFPGKTWEIIPHKNTLQVTTTVCDEPKIPSRRIWYQWGFIHDEGKGYQRSVKDFELWQRHNRMATSFNTHVGHVWQNVYTAYKDEFDAHPEYFLWNTAEKRYETAAFNHGIKIDTFHSGVENIFKAYVLDAFRKNPNADMIGTGPSDGYVYGLVSKTNPDATASDIAFHGTQTAAVAIKAAAITNALFRNKYVGQYAYADYSDPRHSRSRIMSISN